MRIMTLFTHTTRHVKSCNTSQSFPFPDVLPLEVRMHEGNLHETGM